MVFLLII